MCILHSKHMKLNKFIIAVLLTVAVAVCVMAVNGSKDVAESALWTRRQKETTAAKDHEILSLRRQLDAAGDELTEAGRGREIALRENRRLQDDMALMTRENQVPIMLFFSLFFINFS